MSEQTPAPRPQAQPPARRVADEDHGELRIIARVDPPESGANDFIVIGACLVAAISGVVFGLGITLDWPLVVYGAALALGLFAMGLAVRRWLTDRYPDIDAVELRPVEEGPSEVPLSDVAAMPRRNFLGRMVAVAGGVLGLGLLAPIVSLGPLPGDALRSTAWATGRRLVTTDNRVIAPDDLATGGVVTAWPEGAIGEEIAAVIVMRIAGGPEPPTNMDWVVGDDLVAYSKICTHAGCPVGLFRERDSALFCPCHQSTFDARRACIPTFGPTSRPLPQLPLGTDDDGNLVALDDFTEQVGPALG